MSGKVIYGLINGIGKRVYDGDASMTDEFLHQSLLPDLPAPGSAVLSHSFVSWSSSLLA